MQHQTSAGSKSSRFWIHRSRTLEGEEPIEQQRSQSRNRHRFEVPRVAPSPRNIQIGRWRYKLANSVKSFGAQQQLPPTVPSHAFSEFGHSASMDQAETECQGSVIASSPLADEDDITMIVTRKVGSTGLVLQGHRGLFQPGSRGTPSRQIKRSIKRAI